jgi:DHA1 family tetracycline resistance protein-like MFS transporter
MMLLCAVLSSVSYLAISLSSSFSHPLALIFAARVLSGMSASTLSLVRASLCDLTQGSSTDTAGPLIGLAFGLSFTVGPVTGGILSSKYGPIFVSQVALATSIVQIACVALLVPRRPAARNAAEWPKVSDMVSRVSARDTVGSLLRLKSLAALGSLLFNTTIIAHSHSLGLSQRGTGMMLGYVALLVGAFQGGLLRSLSKRYTDAQIFSNGLALSVPCLALWALSPSVSFAAGVLPLLCLSRVKDPALDSLITKSTDKTRYGEVTGIGSGLESLVRAIASVLGGYLIQS